MFYAKKLKFTLQSVSQKCHIESCILEVYSGSRVSGEGELDKTGKRGGRWKRKEPVRKYDRFNKAGWGHEPLQEGAGHTSKYVSGVGDWLETGSSLGLG